MYTEDVFSRFLKFFDRRKQKYFFYCTPANMNLKNIEVFR